MFSFKIDDLSELRLLTQLHTRPFFNLVQVERERLRQWVPWLPYTSSLEATRDFIQLKLSRLANNNGWSAGIWFRGELAGEIGYDYIDWPNRKTEIGYWVGSAFEGRGLVTRACKILVGNAFGELGLNRVQIRCGRENRRSRAVAERLGFVEEGTLREAEQLERGYVDLVVYAMLANDWKATGG